MAAGAAAAWSAKSYASVQGANERVRMGVIGCGGIAGHHMNTLLKMKEPDRIDMVTVCDVYTKRLGAAEKLTGAKPVADYRTILDDKGIDYVLIATPEHWHARMTLDALDAGKHIYVEKPMTHSIEESKKVLGETCHQEQPQAAGGCSGDERQQLRIGLGTSQQGRLGESRSRSN